MAATPTPPAHATGRATELPRSAPSQQGVDARGLSAFLDAADADPAVELHGLMVLRHGTVVAEGWWSPQLPHLLYSLSKSFTATALGIAVAEGLVDLDATVLSYFPELDAEVTDARSRATLVRHVLAMASGHTEETFERAWREGAGDLVRGLLRLPPEADPGTVFAHNQPCTFAVSAIVRRVSGQSLRPRLLDPLGIPPVGWTTDGQGREIGFSGLHATTDAAARLGQLYLQRGTWRGSRLVPEEFVDEAMRVHVDTTHQGEDVDCHHGYGFQLWLNGSGRGYRFDGAYGQYAIVLPELDAVVAITSACTDTQALLTLVWAHVLPALADQQLPAQAADAEADLAARLGTLELPALGGVTLRPSQLRPEAASEPATLTTVGADDDGTLVLVDAGGELRLPPVTDAGWHVEGPVAVTAEPTATTRPACAWRSSRRRTGSTSSWTSPPALSAGGGTRHRCTGRRSRACARRGSARTQPRCAGRRMDKRSHRRRSPRRRLAPWVDTAWMLQQCADRSPAVHPGCA